MTIILSPASYTVRRYERTVVNGVVLATEVERFQVVGSLQPSKDEMLSQFSEGFRPSAVWKLYTDPATALRFGGTDQVTGESYEPDRLEFDGRLLYVHGFEEYAQANGLIPHRKWILLDAEIEPGRYAEMC